MPQISPCTFNTYAQLLEDHLEKLRNGDGAGIEVDEDDEAGWKGWDVDSDSSESDSESEDWIAVDSESDGDLEISDSEDEDKVQKAKLAQDGAEGAPTTEDNVANRISTLATTKVRDQYSSESAIYS